MKLINIIIFGLLFLITSCDAIFENDISTTTVDLILPTNSDTLQTNNVHFKWSELDGATFYNLQIVKSSFDNIETFILDSNISNIEFHQILSPGNYAYKIRGENGAYQSQFTEERNFYIDSVSDLSGQSVLIISPVDNQYMNGESEINMRWQNLYSADQYDYVLKSGAIFETASLLDQVLGQVTLSKLIDRDFFPTEGIYYCGVRAVNNSGATAYSYRTMFVDKTSPNTPELISPLDIATVSIEGSVIFKWNNGADPGTIHSAVYTTLEISTSESFIDYVAVEDIAKDSLSYDFNDTGNYWWRVYAVDAVGNTSEYYSEAHQITIE